MTKPVTGDQPDMGFRDRSHVIDAKGKRIWLFPKKPSGKLHRRRLMVTLMLMLVFVLTPFVRTDGHPLFLFNFIERKFILFGLAFWTQDFFILALSFLALAIFIVLFTAVFGRIFCGWLCPQTIFLEMVFRKLEYFIEGDGARQKKLHKSPFSAAKLAKRISKHFIFLFIAFTVTTALSFWIIGTDQVFAVFQSGLTQSPGYFFSIAGFSGVFYFIFSCFRENACIFLCPYGRLQSVLIDRRTIVVAYDYKRGETRAPLGKRVESIQYGDCVDCRLCNQVCPTGIDIRDGIQLECVNCTACIDACDGVMDKIRRPRGLIRYASMEQIAEARPFRFSPRIILYSAALILLTGLVVYLMTTRPDVDTRILRASGSMAQTTEDGWIVNLYTAKIVNKTFRDIPVHFSLGDEPGTIFQPGRDTLMIPAQAVAETSLIVKLKPSVPIKPQRKIKIFILRKNVIIETVSTFFMEKNIGITK